MSFSGPVTFLAGLDRPSGIPAAVVDRFPGDSLETGGAKAAVNFFGEGIISLALEGEGERGGGPREAGVRGRGIKLNGFSAAALEGFAEEGFTE